MKRMEPIYGWTVVKKSDGAAIDQQVKSYGQFGFFKTKRECVASYDWIGKQGHMSKWYRPAKIVIREFV